MVAQSSGLVTKLLSAARAGDTKAFNDLYSLVYDELRGLARIVRRGGASQTLNTTALVHEAYVKLVPSKDLSWESRAHFMRVAARAMRQVLISAANRRNALKRGGGGQITITFNEALHATPINEDNLLALDASLETLAEMDARAAEVVECRFFGGLSMDETAQVLGVSTATVKRDWRSARAWLAQAMT